MDLRLLSAVRPAAVLAALLLPPATASAQSARFEQVEPQAIEQRLRQYAGSNPVRGATVKRLFRESGCESVEEHPVLRSSAPNVSCTLPGTDEGIIVVGAHFDHVPVGDGVVDNWSGAALLPSLYESLRSIPRRHTFVFVSFTDEELGFLGSESYTAGLSGEEIGQIRAMVNLDTLGLGPTEIWVSDSDPKLVKSLIEIASAMKLPVRGMNVDGVGDSDGRPFKKRKIPTITLHSITNDTLGILHTGDDRFSAIKLEDYYGSYRLIAGFLAALDAAK